MFTRHVDYDETRVLKSQRNQPRSGNNTDRTFSPPTMKVASLLFTLGLGALAIAHPGHESTNVKDVSAQSTWDSTIGKGVPALVELYVP